MITFKNGKLSQKEEAEVKILLQEMKDIYGDFYITKDNLRLFIKDNLDLLFECVSKGDYLVYGQGALAIINGFSDNRERKYLKLLVKDANEIEKLLKVILWNYSGDIHIKIKKNNPIKNELMKNGFRFFGGRGKETLLIKKGRENAGQNQTENQVAS